VIIGIRRIRPVNIHVKIHPVDAINRVPGILPVLGINGGRVLIVTGVVIFIGAVGRGLVVLCAVLGLTELE